jgi:ribose 5-phosphate isomerase A
LLREKIVAAASAQMVVIADEGKWVETLGAFPLPVEVTRYGFALTLERVRAALRETGCAGDEVVLRITGKSNEPVITDGGNYILDAHAKRIPDAQKLADALKRIAGVVEHGLFIGLSRTVILGKAKGAEVKRL